MHILWRSWSAAEAQYELAAMTGQLNWLNGHQYEPQPSDVWLTTNGYDHRSDHTRQLTWYAESANYLMGEYDRYHSDTRWAHRFHFNPNYLVGNTTKLAIGCWWLDELADYYTIKRTKSIINQFGMVLSHKPYSGHPFDFGPIRSQIVAACVGHNFKYYGSGWSTDDINYGGEVYYRNRATPDKFKDARRLLAPMKFVFCVENIYDNYYSINYLTEKIFHAFLSYSVPIYAGCGNVDQLINPALFIDMRRFSFNLIDIIRYCEQMPDDEYNGYLERIEQFLNTTGKNFSVNHQLLELDRTITDLFS